MLFAIVALVCCLVPVLLRQDADTVTAVDALHPLPPYFL
jgi:hypothetical protein